MKYDVAIVGGGAAGLACAVKLSECSAKLRIAVIDAGERLGKKLAATGNGQGNVSNIDMTPSHFYGGTDFAERIACNKDYSFESLFDCLFTADSQGRIYPSGRQASALTDCLIRKIKGRADIFSASKVVGISRGFMLTLHDGRTVTAERVVFCAGGKAQKQFGTDGSAYSLVEKFGHKVTSLYPSLVQLKTDTGYIKTLKGIRADCNVSAYSGNRFLKSVRGDVIFTDYGVSGNAIFALSAAVTDKPQARLSIEFLPDISVNRIQDNLELRIRAGYPRAELLSGTLHNQIGRAVVARAGSEDKITEMLKNFTLSVTGTLGFDYAQVTRGGIELGGVTEELESKFVKNLYFAGEVLDVDGDCGGYNLQWAFSSGMAVARAIIGKL